MRTLENRNLIAKTGHSILHCHVRITRDESPTFSKKKSVVIES